MSDKGPVTITYPDDGKFALVPVLYEGCGIGEVPCRFQVGDKVRRSKYRGDPLEVVENIEWIRDVWHSIEPYWRISTGASAGGQAHYWLHQNADGTFPDLAQLGADSAEGTEAADAEAV